MHNLVLWCQVMTNDFVYLKVNKRSIYLSIYNEVRWTEKLLFALHNKIQCLFYWHQSYLLICIQILIVEIHKLFNN